jgi:hypothetical protein
MVAGITRLFVPGMAGRPAIWKLVCKVAQRRDHSQGARSFRPSQRWLSSGPSAFKTSWLLPNIWYLEHHVIWGDDWREQYSKRFSGNQGMGMVYFDIFKAAESQEARPAHCLRITKMAAILVASHSEAGRDDY